MQATQHETRIEDNGMTGEDERWLPVCSCGWTGFAQETRREAWIEGTEHVTYLARMGVK